MFDLSKAIDRWKTTFKGKCPAEDIEELESHLIEYYQDLTDSGMQPEEAFDNAVERMGDPTEVGREFAKVRTLGDWVWDRFKALDLSLILSLIAVCGIGVMLMYSAANSSGPFKSNIWIQQAVWMGLGFTIILVVTQISPLRIKRCAPYVYGATIVLLLLCVASDLSVSIYDTHRWINVNGLLLKPSMIIPLALPMMIAWLLTKREWAKSWKGFTTMLAIILAPTALILLQPDVGMAVLCLCSGWITLLLSNCRARLLKLTGIVLPILCLLALIPLKSYQDQRIDILLNPEKDPHGSGWHALQIREAIDSGGLLGRGWLKADTHVPHKHGDFILTLVAEQFGLVGIVAILACLGALLYRAVVISKRSSDDFFRLLGFGFAGVLLIQLAINVSVAFGWIPIAIGMPLPLVSYGGSSLVFLLTGFGILASAHRHQRLSCS